MLSELVIRKLHTKVCPMEGGGGGRAINMQNGIINSPKFNNQRYTCADVAAIFT
jgi:hypothetical protein